LVQYCLPRAGDVSAVKLETGTVPLGKRFNWRENSGVLEGYWEMQSEMAVVANLIIMGTLAIVSEETA
jgi:hypothetical protein